MAHPITLYAFPTPNGRKPAIALEELALEYNFESINILEGDQFDANYLVINPNGKIPSLVDTSGPSGKPVSIMESGAILWYLAEKTGKLIPTTQEGKIECSQWLFFQVGHIGPMFGQFGHFFKFAQGDNAYALKRYSDESRRLLGVLEKRLESRETILDTGYSIVDIATFPWVETLGGFYDASEHLQLDEFKNVGNWLQRCMCRDAVKKADARLTGS